MAATCLAPFCRRVMRDSVFGGRSVARAVWPPSGLPLRSQLGCYARSVGVVPRGPWQQGLGQRVAWLGAQG